MKNHGGGVLAPSEASALHLFLQLEGPRSWSTP